MPKVFGGMTTPQRMIWFTDWANYCAAVRVPAGVVTIRLKVAA